MFCHGAAVSARAATTYEIDKSEWILRSYPLDKYLGVCYVYALSPKEDIDFLVGMCYIIENLITLSPPCAYGTPSLPYWHICEKIVSCYVACTYIGSYKEYYVNHYSYT